MKNITLYLNHAVKGWHHIWGRVPMGDAPEEIEVGLPDDVEVVETYGGDAFEFKGAITAEVHNKYGKNGWPRPYLLFVVNDKLHYKFFKLPEDYEALVKGK